MTFYDDMQLTATELLTEFSQGDIRYTPLVPPANPWESSTLGTPIPLEAIAEGVSQQYVSDLITSSDIMITSAVFGATPDNSGKIAIDGVQKEIIKIKAVPSAGTVTHWLIFVKG